jgi:hypothetical protein
MERKLIVFVLFTLLGGSLHAQSEQPKRLLILGPQAGNFKTVIDNLKALVKDGLDTRYDLVVESKKVDRFTSYRTFKRRLERGNPDVLVLMNNWTIDLYRRYQRENPDKRPFTPTIVCMSVFVEESIHGLENTMGVNYEVPIFTTLTILRSHVTIDVGRIGVIHRNVPGFKQFIERQKRFSDRDRYELITYGIDPVQDSGDLAEQVRKGLRELIGNRRIDALWIFNDSILINSDPELRQAWLDELENFDNPVIVNVESFVDPRFGTFGALPDHAGIATQVADFIENVLNNEENVENVEHLLSFHVWAVDKSYLKEESQDKIDRVIPVKRRRN